MMMMMMRMILLLHYCSSALWPFAHTLAIYDFHFQLLGDKSSDIFATHHTRKLFSLEAPIRTFVHTHHTHTLGSPLWSLGTDLGWITIHNGPVLQKSELALDLTPIEWPRPVLCPASSRVLGLPLLLHLFAIRDDGALFALRRLLSLSLVVLLPLQPAQHHHQRTCIEDGMELPSNGAHGATTAAAAKNV